MDGHDGNGGGNDELHLTPYEYQTLYSIWHEGMQMRREQLAQDYYDPGHIDKHVRMRLDTARINGDFRGLDDLTVLLMQAGKPEEMSTGRKIEGAIETAGQGASFGLSDELGGAFDFLPGVVSSGLAGGVHNYTAGRNLARRRLAEYYANNPFLSKLFQGVGTAASSVASPTSLLGKLPMAATPLGRAALAPAAGAAEGALSGFGYGQGTKESVTGAGVGGAGGAALGIGMGVGLPLASHAIRGINRAFNPLGTAAAGADELLRKAGQEAAALRGGDEMGVGMMEQQARELGPEARLADLMPEQVRALTGKSTAAHLALQEQLAARRAGATNRLLQSLGQVGDMDAARLAETQKLRQIGSLYEQLGDVPVSTDMATSLESANAKAVLARARREITGWGGDVAEVFDKDGKIAATTLPFKLVQRVKVQLDDMVGAAFASGRGNLGADIRKVRNAFYQSALDAVEGYGGIQRDYAQQIRVLDALEDGQGFLNKPPRQIQSEISSLSPHAKNAYRLAAVNDVADYLNDVNRRADPTRAFDTKAMDERLRLLFPDQKTYTRFMKQKEVEQAFGKTFAETQGSPTGRNIYTTGAPTWQQVAQRNLAGMAEHGVEAALGPFPRRYTVLRDMLAGKKLGSLAGSDLTAYLGSLRRRLPTLRERFLLGVEAAPGGLLGLLAPQHDETGP